MDSVLILHNLSFLSSGGVVIYFDRIEVVNILDSSSGKVNLMKYYHMSLLNCCFLPHSWAATFNSNYYLKIW